MLSLHLKLENHTRLNQFHVLLVQHVYINLILKVDAKPKLEAISSPLYKCRVHLQLLSINIYSKWWYRNLRTRTPTCGECTMTLQLLFTSKSQSNIHNVVLLNLWSVILNLDFLDLYQTLVKFKMGSKNILFKPLFRFLLNFIASPCSLLGFNMNLHIILTM